MNRFDGALVALVGVAASAISAGCTSHSCTYVYFACNETTVTFQAADDAWAAGSYTLALSLGGATDDCTLTVPTSPSTAGVVAACSMGATYTLSLTPVESCPAVACDGGACEGEGNACTPVANRFQLVLSLQGIPTQVGLDLSLGGAPLFRGTIVPKGSTTEPNGEGCGTCTNASATVAVSTG